MPATEALSEWLQEGVRAEQLGDLDRAILMFTRAATEPDKPTAAKAYTHLADARRSRAEWTEALAAARLGQRVAREGGFELLAQHAMIAEANVLMCRGDFAEAKGLFDQVLASATDPKIRGLALQNVGSMLAQQGELGAAERCFAESYGQFQRAGFSRGEAIALNNYGRVSLDRGDLPLAEGLLRQAVATAREVDHAELIALAKLNLAEVISRQGDTEQAECHAMEALGFFNACGNRWREIECLRLIGAINEQCGSFENSVRCYERGLRLAEELGAAVEIRSLGECLGRVSREQQAG